MLVSRGVTSYKDSGVDIDAQDTALREVRRIVRDTYTPGVLSDIGSFGGLFRGTFERVTNARQLLGKKFTHRPAQKVVQDTDQYRDVE